MRHLQQGEAPPAASPSFTTGFTISPCADETALESEIETARKKVEAGACFVVTPAVFNLKYFESFLKKVKGLGVPIIPTVFLLKSVGMARYISFNEPQAHITEDLIKRIRKAPDRDVECLRIAAETIVALKTMVQGVKIETLGWEHRLPTILDYAGE